MSNIYNKDNMSNIYNKDNMSNIYNKDNMSNIYNYADIAVVIVLLLCNPGTKVICFTYNQMPQMPIRSLSRVMASMF